ncbi:hypothetical protein B0H12DRAFT_51545 [Mycena haematopus]|nr:hypothetical protein B0H12DRAFT_51545 [Mycena haematopus]
MLVCMIGADVQCRFEHTESTELQGRKRFEWYPELTTSWHHVSTLDPKKLRPEDHLSFSETLEIVYFDGIYPNVKIRYEKYRKFPSGTSGFLYYRSRTTPLSPISDSVRFRVTPSPETFEDGEDLLLPNGLPWQIMVNRIAADRDKGWGERPAKLSSSSHLGLCKKLLEDSLLSDFDLDYIENVHPFSRHPSSRTLFALDDPFALERDEALSVVMVGGARARKITLSLPGSGKWPFPQSIARFETLPDPGPDDALTVVLRILRIVEAKPTLLQKYTGPLCIPAEGNLLQVKNSAGQPRFWSFTPRQDSEKARALKNVGKRSSERVDILEAGHWMRLDEIDF